MKIPFNKPYLTGREMDYIYQAVYSGKISGNGMFTQKCQRLLESRYGFKKALLTTSCTDALEMGAILADIKPGDEVIVPSYTFVSTALAFVRQGAKIIFADSRPDHPGIDEDKLEELITPKTKVIVPVHYAGVACDMDKIMSLADKYNLIVIEDAAQAIDSFYRGKPLGSIGHLATFSFHETKNINSGEGGLLAINDERFIRRSEIIWEIGTNRSEFFRGEVNKYGWVDIGSSFLPSEITAAYLWAQLENLDNIQKRRIEIWQQYFAGLNDWAINNGIKMPKIPDYATNNGHLFYMVCGSGDQRNQIINYLKENGIQATFHYLSLHQSLFYKSKQDGRELPQSDRYTNCLLRLPLFYELKENEIEYIINTIKQITK
ncbi:dTDP-4-amino-4,6-dideoxygalactose transaminase [bacterium (Candidatus Gribaldobacteria) CG_4_10_14_0_8_um_filter_33_9]|uniref:dTDP-4-amino-4,6-dideoxygalactose transaminase n=1 Tax=bacterium (Candidatus Gribaldobacteria) CG_4_10_14_0_8_um_filter_33_9 TaxID=2014266 RepID=A0A2M7RPU6_9BACT|nr:MAG: dTDP-4-amino-4,6-dideoxygalactose transaminase [bacterium (Candidatus Gribaldobacteria) CG_4_10_14_0_8_um_filter_33_9]